MGGTLASFFDILQALASDSWLSTQGMDAWPLGKLLHG
jgi:hypothetical protein